MSRRYMQSLASRTNPAALGDYAMFDLGFDVTPFLDAATSIGKSAAEIEAIRKASKGNTGSSSPVIIQQPASKGVPPIVWLLGGVVVLGGGFLLVRSMGKGKRRR